MENKEKRLIKLMILELRYKLQGQLEDFQIIDIAEYQATFEKLNELCNQYNEM